MFITNNFAYIYFATFRLCFETQLCDDIDLLTASIEDDYAESILQTSVHEVIRMERAKEQLDVAAINSRL